MKTKLENIQKRIENAASKALSSPDKIKLIAVSKTQSCESILQAYNLGLIYFGENYVQEYTEKRPALPNNIQWHFIGHIQRNKVNKLLSAGDLIIHSVDNIPLAHKLNQAAETRNTPIKVLMEIKYENEISKTGLPYENACELLETIDQLPNLKCIGLMTIPPLDSEKYPPRQYFSKLRELRDSLNHNRINPITELSMGMTADFETAIEEGATMIRIGTAIFGQRHYN